MFKKSVFRVSTALRGAMGSLLVAGLVLACGASNPQPEPLFAVSDEQPVEPPAAAPQCVDQHDEPVTCLSDSDCCSGFVCGKDPQLSQRQSYCVFGG